MNRKQHIAPSGTIRFRRWSRKNYSAFASLGRCVTIGQVCKSITERALTKQGTPCILLPEQLKTGNDDDPPKMPVTAIELLLAVILPQITTTRPVSGEYSYIDSTNHGRCVLNASWNSTTMDYKTHSIHTCLYSHTHYDRRRD